MPPWLGGYWVYDGIQLHEQRWSISPAAIAHSSTPGQLPEVKRVIAAYGDRVGMEETLPGALAALFKETAPALKVSEAQTGTPVAGPVAERAREALGRYQQAMERLRAVDWGGFGAELEALRRILKELNQPSDGG